MSDRKEIYISKEDIAKQMQFIDLIKNKFNPSNKKYYINTYGCQMNVHDSEKLIGMLEKMGYTAAASNRAADVIVFNTCCVREHAETKVFGNVGALKDYKKQNPDVIICVCGCMMQQKDVADDLARKFKHVDLIFGTHNLHNFPELIYDVLEDKNQIVEVREDDGTIAEGIPAQRKEGIHAYVNIMYGCNNFCSYCIVPYVRGRERSRNADDIIKEINELCAIGYKEVTLLGQNINSYGLDTKNGISFAKLLRRVNDETDILRIRFMTSHPKDLSDELIEAMGELNKVCHHLHLPVQAGSDIILKNMNRKYTTAHYYSLIEKLRNTVPDIEITTDIIVGFPGETDENFEETKNFVKKVMFNGAYTFKYSPRKGTAAAEMPDQVPETIKKQRLNELNSIMTKLVNEYVKKYIGTVQDVLVESSEDNLLIGKTSTARNVYFYGPKNLIGTITNVKITETKAFSLFGEIVD